MSKLTIYRGVSGSGKSTHARQQNAVVVSRDDLRLSLFGDNDQSYYQVGKSVLSYREGVVSVARDAQITALLKSGIDVISDDTNVSWKYVKGLAKLALAAGAEVDVKVFDVPLETCLGRNKMRSYAGGRFVPEDTIRDQHARLKQNKSMTLEAPVALNPYNGTPGKPKAFIFDLDGTVYHMNDKRGPYELNVDVDDPDPVIQDIVNRLSSDGEMFAIAMSGRKTAAFMATMDAMYRDGLHFDRLFMRADGDDRADNIIKAELFDTHVRDNFDVQFVLDDRNQVVDMWRSLGLKCLQVQPGDF